MSSLLRRIQKRMMKAAGVHRGFEGDLLDANGDVLVAAPRGKNKDGNIVVLAPARWPR